MTSLKSSTAHIRSVPALDLIFHSSLKYFIFVLIMCFTEIEFFVSWYVWMKFITQLQYERSRLENFLQLLSTP